MNEILTFSAEPEQPLLTAETESNDFSTEIDSSNPEAAAKPTALNRLANFFLKLAIKTESADNKLNDFKAETKENLESAKEKAKETLIHVGSVALSTLETAGYITIGLGIMGAEAATRGAAAVKESAVEAGYAAVGLGIMGKEAVTQGAKNAYEFASNKVASANEYVNNKKEAALDKVQEVKSNISETVYNTREYFIQKGLEAKWRRDERKHNREAKKAEQQRLDLELKQQREDDKAAEEFARLERANIAAKLKAERKLKYKELYQQTAENAKATVKTASEIGRLALSHKQALINELNYN